MPRENLFVYGAFDWAVTRDQTLRFSFNRNDVVNKNQGIGGYDEPERALHRAENQTNTFRAQEVGPLGRRFFINTRLNVGWSAFRTADRSVEAPTVRVLDAQPFGGAQRAGGRHSRDVNVASRPRLRPQHPFGSHGNVDRLQTGFDPTRATTTWGPTRSRASRPSTRAARAATRGASAVRMFSYVNVQSALYCRTTSGSGAACRSRQACASR